MKETADYTGTQKRMKYGSRLILGPNSLNLGLCPKCFGLEYFVQRGGSLNASHKQMDDVPVKGKEGSHPGLLFKVVIRKGETRVSGFVPKFWTGLSYVYQAERDYISKHSCNVDGCTL